MLSRRTFQPFASRSKRTIIAIVATMAAVSVAGAFLSIRSASGSEHRSTVVQIAERQQMLSERYVQEVLLAREAVPVDPARTIALLSASAHALLDGGLAPAVPGFDDETHLSRASDPIQRRELEQEQRLIADLSTIGFSVLNGTDQTARLTAHEHLRTRDPLQRLRIVAALTASVSLYAARTFVAHDERNISRLIDILAVLGAGGLVISLMLAWALVAATQRQSEHFRSLVRSSTDLVLVLADGCSYVSTSVMRVLGRPEGELLGDSYVRVVHPDDLPLIEQARRDGKPSEIVVRMRNAQGDWRDLEAHVTDLREDRHVRGVVLNARDISERVRLERTLTQQTEQDTFGTQLVEALEMADDEDGDVHGRRACDGSDLDERTHGVAALGLEPRAPHVRGDEPQRRFTRVSRGVAVLVCRRATGEPCRVRDEREPERLPEAAGTSGRRVLGRLRARLVHGSRPGRPAHDGSRR